MNMVFWNLTTLRDSRPCKNLSSLKKVVSVFGVTKSNAGYDDVMQVFPRSWCLTLFGSGCYPRRVPIGRGFALVVRTLGLFKLSRQVEPTTTLDPFRQSAK